MNQSFANFWELRNRSLPVHDPEALARAVFEHFETENARQSSEIRDLKAQLHGNFPSEG